MSNLLSQVLFLELVSAAVIKKKKKKVIDQTK